MSIADDVRRLEDENARLKDEIAGWQEDYAKSRDMLERQASNYREHLAMRNQQLIDAAAAMEEAKQDAAQALDEFDKRLVAKDGEIAWLRDKLARFQLVRGMLNEAEYGKSPLNSEQLSFFQLPAARAN